MLDIIGYSLTLERPGSYISYMITSSIHMSIHFFIIESLIKMLVLLLKLI